VDASTTGLAFAQAIPAALPLTLITYSAILPVEMAGHPGLEIISTGGVLHRKSLCYLGEDAERALSPFHTRQAFFGAKGVDLDGGCTDALLAEIRLKAALARQADELILLADHTKLGNIGLAAFAVLSQVHTLVTDATADPQIVHAIRERGVNVILAPLTDDDALS
jgi:DeoR family fructose operon transcriptional repressor